MAKGKNINLYMMNGNASGIIKCTLANWTGIAYKIPRTELEKCHEIEELKQSGCYFLLGTSDENAKGIIYIGQVGTRQNGGGILNRLFEHNKNPDKDYWNEVIVFITSNDFFGYTDISYLENRFYNLAKCAERYIVKNEIEPSSGHVTEEKESELEEFIEYAKLIMSVLGHRVFIALTEKSEISENFSVQQEEQEWVLSRTLRKLNLTIEAHAKQTSEGWVVLKGSMISPEEDDDIWLSMSQKRKDCKKDENNILQEDVLFNSPSSAAVFVIGKRSNGRECWKTKDGKTFAEFEENK